MYTYIRIMGLGRLVKPVSSLFVLVAVGKISVLIDRDF